MSTRWIQRAAAACAGAALCTLAHAGGMVGTTLPAGFPAIEDASLGKPLIGFGAAGPVHRTPVIFIHGNNDTPFPTACNPFGSMQAFAQFLQSLSVLQCWSQSLWPVQKKKFGRFGS